MHRAFLPDSIPRDQIERIAGVIRRAPSGGFSQGGSIVVVTDDAKRRAIAARFEMQGSYVEDAPVHEQLPVLGRDRREQDRQSARGGHRVDQVPRAMDLS